MTHVMRRGLLGLGLAGALGLAALMITGAGTQTSGPPAPSPTYLQQWGIDIQPLNATEPITASQAVGAAQASFPNLPLGPVTTELVTFSSPNTPTMSAPQPAWLITWDETSSPQGPQVASGVSSASPVVFQHMNEVVSAATGKMLLIFSSP